MNYCKACNILELSNIFNEKELKQNYYAKALLYHPDRNSDIDTTVKFQEVISAYEFLKKYMKSIHSSDIDIDSSHDQDENKYSNILEKFLEGILNKNIDSHEFISLLNNKCSEITFELLQHFSKNSLLNIHKFIVEYADILHISKDYINRLNEVINEHIKNDVVKKIYPTLENLINDEIYKIEEDGEIYYIPMWHHELVYELSNNSLIVECEPKLPDYISLDQYNNLYFNLSINLKSILNDDNITINIANNRFIIPVNELYIKKYQRYIFRERGISLINTNDIYNVENRANIYIDIYFTDFGESSM